MLYRYPTLFPRSGSPWWWFSWYVNGKRIQKSCKPLGLRIDTHPHQKALAILYEHLGLESDGRLAPAPGEETIDWARRFFVTHTERAGRRRETIRNYNNAIDHLSACFGEQRKVAEFARADVLRFQDYLIDRKLAPAGVNRIMRGVRRLFSVLQTEEVIQRNPFARFPRLDEHTTEQRHLTESDARAFIDAMETYTPRQQQRPPIFYEALRRLVYICWSLGIRRTEALCIRRDDVDLPAEVVAVMNVKHRHRIRRWLEIEADVLDDFRWFLDTFDGDQPFKVCHPDTLTHWVKARFRDAGLPESLHLHHLRHTFTRDALDNGTDPWTLMQHQGHVDIRTTIGYAEGARQIIRGIKKSMDLAAHRSKYKG